jgi:membrane-associated phospholipid phosphatase
MTRLPSLRILDRITVFAIAFTASTLSQAAAPLQPEGLSWNPSWAKFRPLEYVLTGVAGVASVGIYFYLKPPAQPHWTGGILFDDSARDALRVRSPNGLARVRSLSDLTALTSAALVVGVDSLVVPLARGKSDVALQLVLMDAEAYAFSTLLTTTTFNIAGRARPSYEDCQRDPSFDKLCGSGSTASFPSGHANASATAAGLSCAHHTRLALYGNAWADAIACGTTAALALSTAAFRVMGDRHYVSDVVVGDVIGFSIGYSVPTLLHYVSGSTTAATVTLAPLSGGSVYGMAASGVF